MTKAAATPSGKNRLLIVEEDFWPRGTLKFIFEHSHELEICTEQEAAVRHHERRPFPVVISSLRPDGLSVTDMLKKFKLINPFTQVILTTMRPTLASMREALWNGVGTTSIAHLGCPRSKNPSGVVNCDSASCQAGKPSSGKNSSGPEMRCAPFSKLLKTPASG